MSTLASPSSRTLRRQAWGIVLAFLLLELALVGGNLFALTQENFTRTRENGWHDFAYGAPMRALAEDLRTTPLTEWLGQRQRELAWLILGDLGPRVRQGCPGWLFLMDELQVHPQAQAHAQTRAGLAGEVYKLLSMRGHHLLVVLVPDKSRIEADHLCEMRRPPGLEGRLAAWADALRGQGIPVLILDQPLLAVKARLGQAFDRTDTHWSQAGAEAAAQAIAHHLHNLGFTPLPKRNFLLARGPLQPRWGDLVRLAGLDQLPASLRPPPDLVAPLSLSLADEQAQAEELSADSLFGDPVGTRLSLVGTSFSRNAGFADFLALAAEADLANLARDGGGFAQAMLNYLERELHGTNQAWVIWEIPERVLTQPLDEAEQRMQTMLTTRRVTSEQHPSRTTD